VNATAVILERPESLVLSDVDLSAPGEEDVVVDIAYSGISTGTERLLFTGRMPDFPGMGYPLIPGYEAVGEVRSAGPRAGIEPGSHVFVPGARCFGAIRGLFGAAASRLVVPGSRVIPLDRELGEKGVLMALAATAHHALVSPGAELPDLVVGHGVLGRLVARIAVALGGQPVVWEVNPARKAGAEGYLVIHPDEDTRRDYAAICDVSGDAAILDRLIARLARGGEVILAGFYEAPLSFAFPPAFMREAKIRIAAEFRPDDLTAVRDLIAAGRLSLDGLVTHRRAARDAADAYRTAFGDPACLKMVIDWSPSA
jgi:3-hydroxyethyl bacteriochlorophyllide a dehydrogenase